VGVTGSASPDAPPLCFTHLSQEIEERGAPPAVCGEMAASTAPWKG
jgi:hypothetical protein